MQQTRRERIDMIVKFNRIDFVDYLATLGIECDHFILYLFEYRIALKDKPASTFIVDSTRNLIFDLTEEKVEGFVSFACRYYGCTPEELFTNPSRYQLDWFL